MARNTPELPEEQGDSPEDDIFRGNFLKSEWKSWIEEHLLDSVGLREDQVELNVKWGRRLRNEWMAFRKTSVENVWNMEIEPFFSVLEEERSEIYPEEFMGVRERIQLMRKTVDACFGLSDVSPLDELIERMREPMHDFTDDVCQIMEGYGGDMEEWMYSAWALPFFDGQPVILLTSSPLDDAVSTINEEPEVDEDKVKEIIDPRIIAEAARLLKDEYLDLLGLLLEMRVIHRVEEHIGALKEVLINSAIDKLNRETRSWVYDAFEQITQTGVVRLSCDIIDGDLHRKETYEIGSVYMATNESVLRFSKSVQAVIRKEESVPEQHVFLRKVGKKGKFEYGVLQDERIEWWNGETVLEGGFDSREYSLMRSAADFLNGLVPINRNKLFVLYGEGEKAATIDEARELRSLDDLFIFMEHGNPQVKYSLLPISPELN